MSVEQALGVYRDPRFAGLNSQQSYEALNYLFDNMVRHDELYRAMNFQDREAFKERWLQQKPRALENYQPVNEIEEALLNGQSRVGTRERMLNLLAMDRSQREAFGITGGLMSLSRGDDVLRDTIDQVNPDVLTYASRLQGDIEADGTNQRQRSWNIGANASAVVGDIALNQALYGTVAGGGGLLTSALYKAPFVQKIAQMGTSAARGRRLLGQLGTMGVEALAEGAGYIGEEALIRHAEARATGQEVDPLPLGQTFLQGVALSSVGNILGEVAGRALGVLRSTFTWRGLRGAKVTGNPVEAIQQAIARDGKIPEEVLNGLRASGADTETLERLQRATVRANEAFNNPELGLDQDRATEFVFNDLFDANLRKKGDGFAINQFQGIEIPEQSFKSLTELNENFNLVINKAWEGRAKLSSQFFGDIKVTVDQAGVARQVELSKDTLISTFVKQGEVDTDGLTRVLRAADPEIEVKANDDFWNLKKITDGKVVYTPRVINNAEEGLAFARRLLPSIKAVDINETLSYIREAGRGLEYNAGTLRKLLGKKNVKIASDGTVEALGERFSSIDKAMAAVQARGRNPEDIISELGKRDIYIQRLDEGGISVAYGSKAEPTDRYSSFEDMFANNPATRLGGTIDESFSIVSPDLQARNTVEIATGGMRQLTEALDKWGQDTSKRFLQNISGDKIYVDDIHRKFHIEFGDSGIRVEADSLKEAKRIVKQDYKKIQNLQNLAELHGYRVSPTSYGYILRGNGLEGKTFASEGALRRFLGKQEQLLNLKEFTGLTDKELFDLNNFVDTGYQRAIKDIDLEAEKLAKKGAYSTSQIANSVRDFTVDMKNRIKQLGDLQAASLHEEMLQGHRIYEQSFNQFAEQSNEIFAGYSVKELEDMQDVFSQELAPELWKDSLKAFGYGDDVVNSMLGTMGQVRQVYDLLGETFGIDPATWIKHFATRVRETDLTKLMDYQNFQAKNILDPRKQQIKDLDFYSRNLRQEDFLYGKNGNIKTMLDLYARAGYKELYLARPIANAKQYLKGNVDQTVHALLHESTERVSGRIYNTERMKRAIKKRISNQLLIDRIDAGAGRFARLSETRKAALKERVRTRDMDYLMSTLINSSVMSFKLRLPLRNVSQVYTTLGPFFGNEYVWKAMGDVYKNGDQLYREALEKGIIQSRDVDQMHSYMAWLNNANRAGMNHFKNSDDFTRIVAHNTIGYRFDDAFNSLQAREIDFDKFLQYSKASMLDPADRKRFIEFIQRGEIDSAKTLMQQRGTAWTMFDYSTAVRPEGQTTGMGRLLGQFSTYSLGYMQMVKRAMVGRSAAEIAAFAIRLAMNTYAVYYLYTELMGIEGMPTNPLGTMMFTGGPMLGAMAGIYNSVTDFNMTAGQKAMAVGKELKTFVPFWGISKKLSQAVTSIVEEDYANAAIYALGGSPARD